MMIRKGNRLVLVALGILCCLALTTCGDLNLRLTITDMAIQYTWEPIPAGSVQAPNVAPYLRAPTPTSGESFGYSVDISDKYAVVGTLNNKAYVFVNNSSVWAYQTTLTATGGVSLGYSVAVSGDYIVAGDPSYSTGGKGGSACLFHYNGTSWTTIGWLNCPSSGSDAAGFSVDIDGDYVAVGSPYYSSNVGCCYIFYRNEGGPDLWGRQKTIGAPNPSSEFGSSVSISGENLIIGAPKDDTSLSNAGAFCFSSRTGTTWSLPTVVTAQTPHAGGWFGFSVAISGINIAVGEQITGNAFLYKLIGSSCSYVGPFSTSDSSSGDEFGNSVSISDTFSIIGSHWHNTGATHSGTAYIFKNSLQNSENAKINKDTPSNGDELGLSVGISSGFAIIGIPYDDQTPSDSGKVIIYCKKRI